MYKALLWKEYRETRLSLALTILSCSILSWILYSYSTSEQVSFSYLRINRMNNLEGPLYVIIVFIISLYTIMVSAEAFSSEYQSNTFDFLASRAVTRKVLWQCKFGFRILTLLPPLAVFFFISKYTLLSEQAGFQQQCMFALSALFIFSASFFFSTIINRPVKAGTSGLIIFVGYAMLLAYFSVNYVTFVISCFIISIFILAASFFIFTRNKLSRAL